MLPFFVCHEAPSALTLTASFAGDMEAGDATSAASGPFALKVISPSLSARPAVPVDSPLHSTLIVVGCPFPSFAPAFCTFLAITPSFPALGEAPSTPSVRATFTFEFANGPIITPEAGPEPLAGPARSAERIPDELVHAPPITGVFFSGADESGGKSVGSRMEC
ncbi:hypothetical protein NM688_g6600 [Phlebia brevispora]|uniref:Uncharacterized protein n=1 Tax=Phlebia brevispora TaxID=194682 RepID=A0ACC1SEJ8_9APHY|nr:hypothetical protein NM688_g6600 [Phlebia brevispora]